MDTSIISTSRSARTTRHSTGLQTLTSSISSTNNLASSTSSTTSIPTALSSSPSTLSTITRTSVVAESEIAWGPAITASSLPPTSTHTPSPAAGAKGVETPGPLALSSGSPGFSKSSRNILIVTTVIGGTFVIALLIYAIYKRRQGASYAQILHVKPRAPSTVVITPTPTPMRDRFKSFPIVRQVRYSVHSSKHGSAIGSSHGMRQKAAPSDYAARFYAQNQYIQNQWKTDLGPTRPSTPPQVPVKDTPNRSTFLFDASPTSKTTSVKEPEKARISVSVRPLSQNTRLSSITANSSGGALDAAFVTPPGSPQTQSLLTRDPERWSWTNSQAPTTPRMGDRRSHGGSSASSRRSVPRFRSVVSWVRGQSERIDEETPPVPTAPQPPAKTARAMLKNQAVMPILAPPPASKKLTKAQRSDQSHAQKPSLTSLFKAPNRPRGSSKDSGQAPSLPGTIELNERSA